MASDSVASDRRSTDATLRRVAAGLQSDKVRMRRLLVSQRNKLEKLALKRLRPGAKLRASISQLQSLVVKGRGALGSIQRIAKVTGLMPKAPVVGKVRRNRVTVNLDGRRVGLPAAHRNEIDALRASLDKRKAWTRKTARSNADELAALERNQEELARIIEQLQAERYIEWLISLFNRLEGIELKNLRLRKGKGKLQKAQRATQAASQQQAQTVQTELQRQIQSRRYDILRNASTTMQTATYGVSNDLFARDNWILGANEVVWGWVGGDSPLNLATPVVSAVVADQVTEDPAQADTTVPDEAVVPSRYIAGMTTTFTVPVFDNVFGFFADIPLVSLVPAVYWPAFSGRSDVPVQIAVNTVAAPGTEVAIWGTVNMGQLRIVITYTVGTNVTALLAAGVTASWVIDLFAPSVDPGQEPSMGFDIVIG